jgi:uncharacterized protein (TIGR00730 family)
MAQNNMNPLDQLDFYAIDNRTAFIDETTFSVPTPVPQPPSPRPERLSADAVGPVAARMVGTPENPPTVICVFCGASPGSSPAYMAAAQQLAHVFHENKIRLVYGGGTVGLMGELARTLVSLSGPDSVRGVIPEPLVKYEQGPDSRAPSSHKHGVPDESVYGRTTVVKDMHSRKLLMAQTVLKGGPGSGFIALPGGFGTLEELMEVVTWNQLGIHSRGIVVLNIEGYWDGLLTWVDNSITAGFVRPGNRGIFLSASTAEESVKALAEYKTAEGRFKLDWGTL